MRFWILGEIHQFAGEGKHQFVEVVAADEESARQAAAAHFDEGKSGSGAIWLDPAKSTCFDTTRPFRHPTQDDPAVRTWEA